MKLIFPIILFLFSHFSQAQVLIKGLPSEYDFNQFNWEEFNNKAQEYIDFKNDIFNEIGVGFIISRINLDKLDLIRIEQELGLYKMGVKMGLSSEMVQAAEEAIALHWHNINSIENQIKAHAGLVGGSVDVITTTPMVGQTEDYYKGMRELHKGDHEVVFNMVEKKDEALYKALGSNDEVYAGFVTPYIQRYMGKMGGTAEAYWGALQSAYEGKGEFKTTDVARLIEMYSNSLEIYKCFVKNFKAPGGVNQQELMGSIHSWHTNQALLGMNGLMETYNVYGDEANPSAVVKELLGFYDAPMEVKEKIGDFLRNDILNNEEYIKTDDRKRLQARTNALIGLHSFGLATLEEEKLFNEAIKQGIIKYRNPHAFSGHPLPLPK